MDPGTYKNTWSAANNGTYWAGARLLAQVAHEKELTKKKSKGKRKSGETAASSGGKKAKVAGNAAPLARKKTPTEMKLEALQLIQRINAVEGVTEGIVYDTCPQLVAKMKRFLQRDGMTKANLLLALGNINNNSLSKFLAGKKQDQCGNIAYRAGYVFFEKLRILEGEKKSAARKKNEREHPQGVSLIVMYYVISYIIFLMLYLCFISSLFKRKGLHDTSSVLHLEVSTFR